MDNLLAVANTAGVWVGFLLSLMIFSRIFGDHLVARFSQYLLVGASFGYLAVLVIQNVLRPRLIEPLMQRPSLDLWLLVPLLLGVLLSIAGLDRIVQQTRARAPSLAFWRRGLNTLGVIPLALLIGIAIATAIVGTIQGTLLPQFLAAAQAGIPSSGTNGQMLTGILTLLVTTGALLHLYVEPMPAVGSSELSGTSAIGRRLVRSLIGLWTWLGKRILWLAAGMIFARLIASRLSLLIARFDYFYRTIEGLNLW